ncbi:MAG: competence/damage-inducible protein A [Actinobacteria bacterium]|nr:MAG: competence/damage-inducible protein A [Actinomycetota bacterium]
MAARAGILVTGTEVLTGRVLDRNGGWVSERLRELGVEHEHTIVVGDRPRDMLDALAFLRDAGAQLIVTTGGLGPTADDLTAEIVGRFQGRDMVLDEPTEARIAEIIAPMLERWPNLDIDAVREANRKQAVVPRGSTILPPVGTAPGLVVPPADDRDGPTILVLPGPPRELQPMWPGAVRTEAFRRAIDGSREIRQDMLRLFGIPESEIAATLRAAEERGIAIDRLEITTCLRRGEIEVVTRYPPEAQEVYRALAAFVAERHADTLFSDDGTSIDEQVARLLREHGDTIAVAESCTGGLLGGRLTDLAGSSAYVRGGLIVYSNEAKVALAGVDPEVIARVGAVSGEVADALADGARERLEASVGVGVTGIAGPDGGTSEKPVGTVWFSVSHDDGRRLTRHVRLPGGRFDIRDRSTTVALHLVRRLLLGASDSG